MDNATQETLRELMQVMMVCLIVVTVCLVVNVGGCGKIEVEPEKPVIESVEGLQIAG